MQNKGFSHLKHPGLLVFQSQETNLLQSNIAKVVHVGGGIATVASTSANTSTTDPRTNGGRAEVADASPDSGGCPGDALTSRPLVDAFQVKLQLCLRLPQRFSFTLLLLMLFLRRCHLLQTIKK